MATRQLKAEAQRGTSEVNNHIYQPVANKLQTNMATSQLNLDSLNAGRRSSSEANMATTQRKPSQGQSLTSKHGHLTA